MYSNQWPLTDGGKRDRREGKGGGEYPGKITEGENIEQADVLLGLVQDKWSKGGVCNEVLHVYL